MRLIDADKLKESLKELKVEGNSQKYVQGLQDAIDGYFPQIIDDEPTVDTKRPFAKIVPSNWTIKVPSLVFDGKCSNCYTPVFDTDEYCRECGAKLMKDGESDA